jgi:hypothetical protein
MGCYQLFVNTGVKHGRATKGRDSVKASIDCEPSPKIWTYYFRLKGRGYVNLVKQVHLDDLTSDTFWVGVAVQGSEEQIEDVDCPSRFSGETRVHPRNYLAVES